MANRFTKLAVQSAAEFLGMFFFIFMSLGAVQSAFRSNDPAAIARDPSLAYLQIALSFGFSLASAIFLVYRISGGALNPAVNFGLFVAGVMDPITMVAYTIAQMCGSMTACALVSVIYSGAKDNFNGTNQLMEGVSIAQGFFMEMILTCGLVLIVLFLAVDKSKVTFYAPMMIGVYVFICHINAIPYTNTSVNPARSFGASVVSGVWRDQWIFWVAPLMGGGIAGLIHRAFKYADYESLNPGQDADHVESADEKSQV
ncbi:hypothetical protein HDU98_003947 [Podochytrium sp. JEL0797]|nr:hypothetical protein HDU98_003947 [Podochytrium sp. JEL0797]